MFKILILICPMGMEHAACQEDTALDVVRAMEVRSEQQCGFLGQAMLAPTALVPDPKKQYLKVVCLREASVEHRNRAWNGAIITEARLTR